MKHFKKCLLIKLNPGKKTDLKKTENEKPQYSLE
jgi:hypothetical protein